MVWIVIGESGYCPGAYGIGIGKSETGAAETLLKVILIDTVIIVLVVFFFGVEIIILIVVEK